MTSDNQVIFKLSPPKIRIQFSNQFFPSEGYANKGLFQSTSALPVGACLTFSLGVKPIVWIFPFGWVRRAALRLLPAVLHCSDFGLELGLDWEIKKQQKWSRMSWRSSSEKGVTPTSGNSTLPVIKAHTRLGVSGNARFAFVLISGGMQRQISNSSDQKKIKEVLLGWNSEKWVCA